MNNTNKPTIGILGTIVELENHILDIEVHHAYTKAVLNAGGIPIILSSIKDSSLIKEYIGLCDGFIFTGGYDIEPSLYNETPHETVTDTDPLRDWFEPRLMQTAMKHDLPILAICRGHQMLNVVRGGTLWQDLPSERPASTVNHRQIEKHDIPSHSITLQPSTKLFKIVGSPSIMVNSRHHQAIKTLGSDLVATAHSEDGIIEAIEDPNAKFIVGIQSHPEDLIKTTDYAAKIFSTFIQAIVLPKPLPQIMRSTVTQD
ncbi:MAG: putative glutamine amidotransferase [bacterium ADurb.Bin400]|nr:MAG: putative glutamine amidotransferase [bacterium ADurb.Bin400]